MVFRQELHSAKQLHSRRNARVKGGNPEVKAKNYLRPRSRFPLDPYGEKRNYEMEGIIPETPGGLGEGTGLFSLGDPDLQPSNHNEDVGMEVDSDSGFEKRSGHPSSRTRETFMVIYDKTRHRPGRVKIGLVIRLIGSGTSQDLSRYRNKGFTCSVYRPRVE